MPVVDDPMSTDELVSVSMFNSTVEEKGAICESVHVARLTSLLELLAFAPQWVRDAGTPFRLNIEYGRFKNAVPKRPRYG